jgi:hypothetical protein
MTGGGYGLYGGSPALIGTYKHATNTSIKCRQRHHRSMRHQAPGGVQIGSLPSAMAVRCR